MRRREIDRYLKEGDVANQSPISHDSVTIPANGSGIAAILIPSQYDFMWFTLQGRSTGAYLLTIKDAGTNREFSNKPLHNNTIIGNGNLPYILPQPYLVKRRGSIIFNISDLSGVSNVVQITLGGISYYDESIIKKKEPALKGLMPYFYTTDDLLTVGTAETLARFSVAKDHDFLINKVSYKDTNSSTTLFYKLSSTSGRAMNNDIYIDMASTIGNSQYPYIFQYPTPFFGGNIGKLAFKDTTSSNVTYITFGGIAIMRG